MKILLGGIPLGCDNIGDEAILACVADIVKRCFPGAEITVCTADREHTAELLSIKTAPLYGFVQDAPVSDFADFVSSFDLYLWAGATGLSDYPAVALNLLEAAQKKQVATVVWNVGMDSELNPVFFRLRGRRKMLMDFCSKCCFGQLDFCALAERYLIAQMRSRIRRTLSRCALVVVRDPQSGQELRKCGFDDAVTGADSAILLPSRPQSFVTRADGIHNIGFCISSQRAVADRNGILELWNRILANPENRIVLIPMNPKTDRELMSGLQKELDHPERTLMLTDCMEPGTVQAVAEQCDVIVSSRLHLLILAGNVLTPIAGISRGSKVDNFLDNYGLASSGTVHSCDFQGLYEQIQQFLCPEKRMAFRRKAEAVHEELLSRLRAAEEKLRGVMNHSNKRN